MYQSWMKDLFLEEKEEKDKRGRVVQSGNVKTTLINANDWVRVKKVQNYEAIKSIDKENKTMTGGNETTKEEEALIDDAMPMRNLLTAALYGVLVSISIVGNAFVLVTIAATSWENGSVAASDLILAHLATINLLISGFRNALIFACHVGLEFILSAAWCRVFMFLWMLLRTMSVWATFCVSFFHYLALRRTDLHFRMPGKAIGNATKAILATWIVNFLYSIPAFVYSTRGAENITFSLMLLSSTTTRPLLGCVWNFPSTQTTLLYIAASLVIHEVLPIFLMLATNMRSLVLLRHYTRAIGVAIPGPRLLANRRAAKVILWLVLLFVACWGSNLLAVNYYNFAHDESSSYLLTVANFCASLFLGFSPLVLLAGHSKLRQKLRRLIVSSTSCAV
ncbi:olfactory receptor class A-like protein 4 [Lissotriton helveticus]